MTKVEELIKQKGLLKGWVAKQAGISPSSLSKICTGETKDPRTSVAISVARVLGTTVEELWGHLADE